MISLKLLPVRLRFYHVNVSKYGCVCCIIVDFVFAFAFIFALVFCLLHLSFVLAHLHLPFVAAKVIESVINPPKKTANAYSLYFSDRYAVLKSESKAKRAGGGDGFLYSLILFIFCTLQFYSAN